MHRIVILFQFGLAIDQTVQQFPGYVKIELRCVDQGIDKQTTVLPLQCILVWEASRASLKRGKGKINPEQKMSLQGIATRDG